MDNQWNTGSNQDPQDKEQPDGRLPSAPHASYGGFSPVLDQEPPQMRKHSGLGIASFTLFAVMAVAFISLLVAFITQLADVMDFNDPEAVDSEEVARQIQDMPQLAVIAFLMFGTCVGNLVGLVLGIIGLVQKERKKVFAILGTVFNGLVIGFLLLMFVFGLVIASAAA